MKVVGIEQLRCKRKGKIFYIITIYIYITFFILICLYAQAYSYEYTINYSSLPFNTTEIIELNKTINTTLNISYSEWLSGNISINFTNFTLYNLTVNVSVPNTSVGNYTKYLMYTEGNITYNQSFYFIILNDTPTPVTEFENIGDNQYYIELDVEDLTYSTNFTLPLQAKLNTTITVVCEGDFLTCPGDVYVSEEYLNYTVNITVPITTPSGFYNNFLIFLATDPVRTARVDFLINITYNEVETDIISEEELNDCLRIHLNYTVIDCINLIINESLTEIRNRTIYIEQENITYVPVIKYDTTEWENLKNELLNTRTDIDSVKTSMKNLENTTFLQLDNAIARSDELYNMRISEKAIFDKKSSEMEDEKKLSEIKTKILIYTAIGIIVIIAGINVLFKARTLGTHSIFKEIWYGFGGK